MMYRILFQDVAGDFQIVDADSPLRMERAAFDIASSANSIICIYDYLHKKPSFKCSSYEKYWKAINELVYENKKFA